MANDLTPKTRQTMGRPRGAVGRPQVDVQKVAEALSTPGIDPRDWVKAGTVGVRQEDGTFVTTDQEAVYADPLGAVVDVRLEPDEDIVTLRWSGVGCGRYGRILFPVRPGDEVICLFPDGDMNHPSASIVAVLSNQTAQIPDDWANDRVLIDVVKLEIRAGAIDISSPNLRIKGRPVSGGSDPI